ncbi:MAG: hypothetical protein AAF519_15210 [Bacteroidota bacterium]
MFTSLLRLFARFNSYMTSKKGTVLLSFALTGFIPSYCQVNLQPFDAESIIQARKTRVLDDYLQRSITNILHGRKYNLIYFQAIRNSQFFKEKAPEQGYVEYDEVLFKDIDIQYDLYTQEIVVLIELKGGSQYVTLDTSRIKRFSIGEDSFHHIRNDKLLDQGFYQVAYAGKESSLFISRTKKKKVTKNTTGIEIDFTLQSNYYLRNVRGTFTIKTKKQFLNAFGNSQSVKSIIKKHKIRFTKRQLEKSFITALQLIEK